MTSYAEAAENEPLSEEGTMSFLDHLDELRKRLIRIALFIGIAFVVCFFLSEPIYDFIQVPVRAAMLDAKRKIAPEFSGTTIKLTDLPDETGVVFTLTTEAKIGSILVTAGTAIPCKVRRDGEGTPQLLTSDYFMVDDQTIIEKDTVIPSQLYKSSTTRMGRDNQLVVPTVQGAFNLYIKVSFYAAIFFAVPFLLVQIWGFVAPGLYPHEKKYAAPIIIMASVFFLGGCAFAYYIAFPRAANFLLGVADKWKPQTACNRG